MVISLWFEIRVDFTCRVNYNGNLIRKGINMPKYYLKYFSFFGFLILLNGCIDRNQPQFFPKLDRITERQIHSDLFVLASEEMEGREAGLTGAGLAADYITHELNKINVQSMNRHDQNGGYYQNFQIIGADLSDISSDLTIQQGKYKIKAEYREDYFYFYNSPKKISINAEIVFAGYAINAPEYQYNDFENLDLKDKIVVAYYGEPLQDDTLQFFNGKHRTKYMMPDWKADEVAKRGGSILVLMPNQENENSYSKFLQRHLQPNNKKPFVLIDDQSVPVVYLSVKFAQKVFGDWLKENFILERKRLLNWLHDNQKNHFRWQETNLLNQTWEVNIDYNNPDVRECQNLIALYPGQNSQLKNEYILVGSHYDHEGVQDGKIYLGADDNASGVSATLNITRAFSELTGHERPSRSIIFAFWDAEEKGTLGSKYFVDHSVVPFQNIKEVFNMDMIGRDASFNFVALHQPIKDENAENKVMIFYSAQAPALKDIAIQSNKNIDLTILYDPNVFFTSGSDHMVFHSHHIPIIYYFTGFHTDYTSIGDTPDKINYSKLTRISRHIANFIYTLANSDEIPGFDKRILSAPEGDFRM
jgi:hypothetical protein